MTMQKPKLPDELWGDTTSLEEVQTGNLARVYPYKPGGGDNYWHLVGVSPARLAAAEAEIVQLKAERDEARGWSAKHEGQAEWATRLLEKSKSEREREVEQERDAVIRAMTLLVVFLQGEHRIGEFGNVPLILPTSEEIIEEVSQSLGDGEPSEKAIAHVRRLAGLEQS